MMVQCVTSFGLILKVSCPASLSVSVSSCLVLYLFILILRSGGMLAWLSVWSKVRICIWSR